MEDFLEKYELFHQVYPPLPAGAIFNNLFHD
jgi:hypothetical protein